MSSIRRINGPSASFTSVNRGLQHGEECFNPIKQIDWWDNWKEHKEMPVNLLLSTEDS